MKEKVHASWSEVKTELKGVDPCTEKFAHSYYRAQLHLARGKQVKAKRLFHLLDKVNGYNDFEKENDDLLRQIDLKVRGTTNR